MTDTERLIQIEEEKERVHKEHLKISKSKESKAIVNAIKKATCGTFVGENGSTTLMGWFPQYDKKGRPLNADPNTKTSTINIDGKVYSLTTCEWHSEIWEIDGISHKRVKFISYVDFRPRYIKLRDAKIAKERKGKYVKPNVAVKQLAHIDGNEYVVTKWGIVGENMPFVVAPYIMQEQCETIGLESLDETAKKLSKEIIGNGYCVFNCENEA